MMRPAATSGAALVVCVGMALLLGGCRQEAPTEPNSVTDTAERGPFTFTAEATPRQIWVGDPITIKLRVETPDDHVVQFPSEDDFGEFDVSSIETADPRPGLVDGLVWQQTIVAESFTSGVVEIPSLVVKYADKPTKPETEPLFEHELVTGPLEIEVRSALTSQDSVFEPRDITGTLTPPGKPLSPLAWAGIVGAVVAVAALLVLLIVWLRRLARRPAPPILPEVWALRALARLEAAGLIESGRAKQYYYSLSEIVRVYIERKFALAAPEMTTQEFLTTLARNRRALPYDADRLRDFLEACDLVKYAALAPRAIEAEQALGIARAFIDATAAAGQQSASVHDVPREKGEQAA